MLESLRNCPLAALLASVRSFGSFAATLFYVSRASRQVVTLKFFTCTKQGDPLSGALFAFGLRCALARVQTCVPAALVCIFVNDTIVYAPPEIILAMFQAYVQEAAAVGLSVSTSKCCICASSGVYYLTTSF